VGRDFFLCFSPSASTPAIPDFQYGHIPKVWVVRRRHALRLGRVLQPGALQEVVPVSSTQVAEMVKLAGRTRSV